MRFDVASDVSVTPLVVVQRHLGSDHTGTLGTGTQVAAQVSLTWKLQ
jgi:hypothetical protein